MGFTASNGDGPPSIPIIYHISAFGTLGFGALADAKELNGVEISTSVAGGITAVAVWTTGAGAGLNVFRSLLILMFMAQSGAVVP